MGSNNHNSDKGARELRPKGGGEEGQVGEPNGGVAVAREAVEGHLTGGGSFGSEGRRRGRGEGVLEVWEASPRAGSTFIGQKRGGGGPSTFNCRLEGASMAGLKAPVSWIEEGGEWHRLMGGNEGGLDVTIFLFRWRRQGDRGGGTRPASGVAVLGFGTGGRRRPVAGWAVMVGWADREAEAQWGGQEKSAGWKNEEWAAAGPKGRMGRKLRRNISE
jgi:hypothetical protein